MKNKKGFTLVEIMIVVVIIGLLAAMAIPAFKQVRDRAAEKTAINDARLLNSAAQQYFMDNVDQTTVALATLVGTDQFVKALSPGNTIATANLTTDATRIQMNVASTGSTVDYDF